jgi:hypothetical protein
LVAGVSLMAMACGPRADDIPRVQPGYVKKAIFESDHEWYYRRTVVDSETTNAYVVEGMGDIAIDRVRFRIEEELLIAYKPYPNVPGTQEDKVEGGSAGFEGTVVASWPISAHFDVQREYDPLTGTETNVISENDQDRPWYEREFIRVDWSDNQIESGFSANASSNWFPVSFVSTGSYWTELNTRPTDPYASRFSDDYVEVTDQVLLSMDLGTCAAFAGFSSAAYAQCGYGEAKIRHSFWRIDAPSDYVPKDYPDSVVRLRDGSPVYDDKTGEVEREPIYGRFGFFRLQRLTYDPNYGLTESGRKFLAMRMNLWERSRDDAGLVLPFSQRVPKPIIYYVNVDFPERYWTVAVEVAAEYNRVFSDMVRELLGENAGRLSYPMFEIRRNDCRAENIQAFVKARPELVEAVQRAVCDPDGICSDSIDELVGQIAVGNLDRVCTSLEAATLDPATGKTAFTWQRVGDVRNKMLVWLSNPQQSGWGGYGPMHADAETGEVISATSFIRGFYYERSATDVVDYIGYINGETAPKDIIYGLDVRRQVEATVNRAQSMVTAKPSKAYLQRLESRMDSLGSSRQELLQVNENPGEQLERLQRIQGSRMEASLIDEFQRAMASEGNWRPGEAVSEELNQRASPYGRMFEQNPEADLVAQGRTQLAEAGYCFLEQDVDPHWAGLALALKDLPREERYNVVARRLAKHVILHELGHNVGLTHNFEGTYDALNYNDQFWSLINASEDEKIRGRFDEFRHTTVMEYISSKGAFADFLGKYDVAAIRFGYAGQVEVFDSEAVDPNLEGGEALRAWRYYNDYQKIPDKLCGASGCADTSQSQEALRKRKFVAFDPQNPPENEVPYLFCDNRFNGRTPFCATFDYGSNLREIFANHYSRWSNYYFFNNFSRDRLSGLNWAPSQALRPAIGAMFFNDVVAQNYYYLKASDPAFSGSDLEADMATTVAHGLNMAAEVLATPDAERLCPLPGYSRNRIYVNWGFRNDCDEYAPIESLVSSEAIDIPLGDARPAGISFTEDYEDFQWSFVGSYFDKSNMLLLLGLTSPTILRFNYDIDIRTYRMGLYRLFEPELQHLYSILSASDRLFIQPSLAEQLGSFWCRDPSASAEAHKGRFVARKLIDPVTNESLPGPPADCVDPSYVYPEFLGNTPFQAMFAAHALFSSDQDSQLDMGQNLKVFVRGGDDDVPEWASLPSCVSSPNAACYCGLVDALTGIEYRAISIPGQEDTGCEMVKFAEAIQGRYLTSNGDPERLDQWRQWIERLEFARDLYRMYQGR